MIVRMRRSRFSVLLLLAAATACTSSHSTRPAAATRHATSPATPDWRFALRVHDDGILQPALPPRVGCSTQLCGEASDPVGPLLLRGDAHLDGGCVWAVSVRGPGGRISIIWPAGTYATFGRVIRVYSSDGHLLADSTRPFGGSGWAPADDQLPSRCLVDDRNFVAIGDASPLPPQ